MNAPRFTPPYPYTPGDVPPPAPHPVQFPIAPAKRVGSRAGAIAFVLAVLSFCLLGLVAVAVNGLGEEQRHRDVLAVPDAAPSASRAADAPARPSPSSSPPAVVLNEGTYETAAKTDEAADLIAAGKWRVRTPRDGVNCYWARLRNFDGQILGSVIANGNIAPGATAIVNVKPSDAGLELRGDCEARK